MTSDEFLQRYGSRRSKYGNYRVEADGHIFDSRAEARRYHELKHLVDFGNICDLRVHPRYVLQAAFKDWHGKTHRAISYEADFEYREGETLIVEDVKGTRTAVFNIKEKMFLKLYPSLDLRVVEA